ncbi:DNA-processing protein DprA [Candidatus Micrarchaeota archaeon]|nr:DNA-processing protein DprA [Candidatus Micrarchaeota archaeon]MBU1166628.1 DNA-processing protein DprA [Candidatus Micrarchaeota archaeon]MBU1886923.1 DNA-processing protein DprA [Candidatus Micrarchaeota archaeon]
MVTELTKDELVNWFKLGQVTKLGPQKILKLLGYFNDLSSIYQANDSELLQTRIFNEEMLKDFNKLRSASDENFIKNIEECNKKSIKILTLLDKNYPKELKFLQSPPLTLFLLGKTELFNGKKIAIVGTRQPDKKAAEYAFSLSNFLAEKGITIVSGGALGIDSEAHKGALSLETGKTISVLGSGFNNLYPPENTNLFDQIKKKGLLISEYLPNFKGSRISYLQRNRITSGLSNALFLVAAQKIGGSLTQVKIAHEQRKSIFCPQLNSNILPNEGVKEAIKKYGTQQIKDQEHLFRLLNSSLNSFL